jgi:hypothetical protein
VNIPVPVGTNPVGLAIVPGEEGALLRKVGMHRSADRTPAESALMARIR